jgi:hypothetical protein
MVLLQDAVVIIALVLSSVEASLCWAMALLLDAVVIVVLGLSLLEASLGDGTAAGCSGERRAGALLGGGIGLANDGCCCWCSGDRRAGALLVWRHRWAMVLLQDAVVIVVLGLSLLEASLR